VLGFRSSGADLIGVYPLRSNFRAGEDGKASASRQTLDSHHRKTDGLHGRSQKHGKFLDGTSSHDDVYVAIWQVSQRKFNKY